MNSERDSDGLRRRRQWPPPLKRRQARTRPVAIASAAERPARPKCPSLGPPNLKGLKGDPFQRLGCRHRATGRTVTVTGAVAAAPGGLAGIPAATGWRRPGLRLGLDLSLREAPWRCQGVSAPARC